MAALGGSLAVCCSSGAVVGRIDLLMGPGPHQPGRRRQPREGVSLPAAVVGRVDLLVM